MCETSSGVCPCAFILHYLETAKLFTPSNINTCEVHTHSAVRSTNTHRTPQPKAHCAGRSGHNDRSCTSRRTRGPSRSPHPSQQHGCVQTSSSWCCRSPASMSAPHPTLQRILRLLQSCRGARTKVSGGKRWQWRYRKVLSSVWRGGGSLCRVFSLRDCRPLAGHFVLSLRELSSKRQWCVYQHKSTLQVVMVFFRLS